MKLFKKVIDQGLPLSLLILLFIKTGYIEDSLGLATSCIGCFVEPVIKHDAFIFLGLTLIYILSNLCKTQSLRIFFRLMIVLTSLIYALDFLILWFFNTRLVVDDFLKYSGYAKTFLLQVVPNYLTLSGKFLFLTIFVFELLAIKRFLIQEAKRKHTIIAGVLSIILLITIIFTRDVQYVHSWVVNNFIEQNLDRGLNTPYSKEFAASLKEQENKINLKVCSENTPNRENIIILVIESLSMYHSQFFSGMNNITPHLDKIAEENVAFMNFFANGFTTEQGMVALILGKFPIPAQAQFEDEESFSFKGFYASKNSLPILLKENKYTTEFLTSGDLTFANKINWLKSSGFDYIEGHNHPYYNSWPRFLFKAAPDEALFNRALDRIKTHSRSSKPLFLYIETVSTHQPFINPDTGEYSEVKTFQYVDRQIKTFYDELKNTGYFNKGILIITSDQRSMTPLRKEELIRYGQSAAARIPLIIVQGSQSQPEKVYDYFQQTDIYQSILNHTSPLSCENNWRGDLLKKPRVSPKYILYSRGDNRKVVSVFTPDTEGMIEINGDKTAVISGDLTDADQIINKINLERITRD